MSVADQGARAAGLLGSDDWRKDDALRDEALVRSSLAVAQQSKVANLISYLTARTSAWPLDEHNTVRAYLGLPPLTAQPRTQESPWND